MTALGFLWLALAAAFLLVAIRFIAADLPNLPKE